MVGDKNKSLIIIIAAISLLFAFTGCSYTTESDGLKVLDVERGDSIDGLEADDEDDDIMKVTVEPTDDNAKGKLNELVIANDTNLFKLFHKDELVAEASSISKASGNVDGNRDDSLLEITFPVPKNLNKDLFLSIESFSKISLDDHSSRSRADIRLY